MCSIGGKGTESDQRNILIGWWDLLEVKSKWAGNQCGSSTSLNYIVWTGKNWSKQPVTWTITSRIVGRMRNVWDLFNRIRAEVTFSIKEVFEVFKTKKMMSCCTTTSLNQQLLPLLTHDRLQSISNTLFVTLDLYFITSALSFCLLFTVLPQFPLL